MGQFRNQHQMETSQQVSVALKPFSQLAHEHSTTLCDWNFLALHKLLHALRDFSYSLHVF